MTHFVSALFATNKTGSDIDTRYDGLLPHNDPSEIYKRPPVVHNPPVCELLFYKVCRYMSAVRVRDVVL